MKFVTTAFLTLALAVLFVQAAPTILETRENNRPARRDTAWNSLPVVTEINEDKGPARRRRHDTSWSSFPEKAEINDDKGPARRDLGLDSVAGTFAKPQNSGWNKKREDVGWNAERNKPKDTSWVKKREDVGWSTEPIKPQDSGWGP
ncbi:hypothetical protein BGZ95_006001 [Linnemannia exigua]|uniref:Uncharacterized protein n=1 Tax=Linnemannia exigua TaxID=604196 RepID=A0AAD4D3D9_9FUNG|nr:hypothetical protein BGZ95_006001 [Linnemannia exigua]